MRGIDAYTAGELHDSLVGGVAPTLHNVGGAEPLGDLLAVGVSAEGDDPLRAEPFDPSTAVNCVSPRVKRLS